MDVAINDPPEMLMTAAWPGAALIVDAGGRLEAAGAAPIPPPRG